MEFHVCAPTGGGRTTHSCGTNIPTDGLGRIPPFFCAAMETSRDISTDYIETEVNSLHRHKFEHYAVGASAYTNLSESGQDPQGFWYMVEVYVDDFMSLVIPVSREQLRHVANVMMHGIHDVFPPDINDDEDPISEKKMKKGEGLYDTKKMLLGFNFNGDAKTMWLESAKREKLLTILKGWIRTGKQGSAGIPLGDFESIIAKIRHAFQSIPAGCGLLSPCNRVLTKRPPYVYLQRNVAVLTAVEGCQTLLRESTKEPTRWQELVSGWPDYIGIVDASGQGVGGVVVGELSDCTPVVFRWEWPANIKNNIVSSSNPTGGLTNSDLEMAGLLMLWLTSKGCAHPSVKNV
jgi:hypothetical protein